MLKTIKEGKRSLRKKMRDCLRELGSTRRETASRLILQNLQSYKRFRDCRVLCAFAPMPTEPDLNPLLFSPRRKFDLILPRVCGDRLLCFKVSGPDDLAPGILGINEPGEHCQAADPSEADLILVPGLAFAADGRRLGRGKGYYDRFLSGIKGYRLAIAFDIQIVQNVPCEAHDLRVDAVLTESGVRPAG